jgi:hypothetical protein
MYDLSIVEEEVPFRKICRSRREYKSCSWMWRRLKPGLTMLANASRNLTDRLLFKILRMEVDSSTSTVALRNVGGNEKEIQCLGA